MIKSMYKYGSALVGGLVAFSLPLIPLIWVSVMFIVADNFSAYSLNKRIIKRAQLLEIEIDKDSGKYKSVKGYKSFQTLRDVLAVLFLAHALDLEVLGFLGGLNLAAFSAGIFCILQSISILENASSCNGSRWAKIMQKIVVDKTSRHLDIDLSEVIEEMKEEKKKKFEDSTRDN